MEKVLSQEEVDSLLEGISEGKVKTETDVPESDEGLRVYDFRRQESPLHVRMPVLRNLHERFVTLLKESLSNATGLVMDVSLSYLESVRFGEFCRSLALPTSLNIFKMEPLRGLALLVLEGPLVFSFVDCFFGGKGLSQVKLEGRAFTTIESKIIEKIVRITLADLEQAWFKLYPLKMVFTRSEMDPQFASIVTPNDMTFIARFTLDVENASGTMTICIPYATIEPIREKLTYRFHSLELEVDEAWRKYIQEKIKEMTVNLSCTLGTTHITGRELLEIKVEDVIPLDQKTSDPLLVNVEDVAKFYAHPGTYNDKKAIRIEGKINEE